MAKIQVLPQNIVNLIAAGEVVERPASVLKELLENSIDAESTEIIVNLKDYGKSLIEVQDNGMGMTTKDAKLAFKQHSTSKIDKKKDLESINTMGFRGEALASISSVAEKIIVETKPSEEAPTKLIIKDTEITEEKSTKTSAGTTMSVINLFKNVPARKKFLKSDNTELKHLMETFINIALANLDIHFELYHNNTLIHRLTKTESRKERIFEIWGEKIAKNLITPKPFQNEYCKIEILLGKPEIARKSSILQYSFVNDRYIDNKVIFSSLKQAYRGLIHRDLKPIYFIFIHINPRLVDVNVHPRKLEIRFENPQEIFKLLLSYTKKVLETESRSGLINRLREDENIYQNRSTNENFTKVSDVTAKYTAKTNTESKKVKYIPGAKSQMQKVNQALSFTENILHQKENKDNKLDKSNKTLQLNSDNMIQIFNTYILIEKEESVLVIDQHAAAEKILFEEIINNIGEIKTKPMLIPEIVDLQSFEKKTLLERQEELEKIGVYIEDFGGNSIQVIEIPEVMCNINSQDLIQEILNEEDFSKTYEEYKGDNTVSRELYTLLATTACHGAIRAGQKLNKPEMVNLVKDLLELDNPSSCPHGRPVLWELTKYEIEKNFKRII